MNFLRKLHLFFWLPGVFGVNAAVPTEAWLRVGYGMWQNHVVRPLLKAMSTPAPHPDSLWAPWRLAYITGNEADKSTPEPAVWRPGADTNCFLCRAAAVAETYHRDLGVLERTKTGLVLLNRYPYANGHLLIAPLDHQAMLADLTPETLLDLQQRLADWCCRLEETLQAQGLNIGLNLGQVAGAGVPGHLHWHLVPRWPGDVNFMTSVAGVRVIPQALDALWDQLRNST